MSGGERDPAEIDRQTAEHLLRCGNVELTVRHLYATLHHREWDGQDTRWLVAYLVAEHGLDFPEAMRLAEPGAWIELGERLRAGKKTDPPSPEGGPYMPARWFKDRGVNGVTLRQAALMKRVRKLGKGKAVRYSAPDGHRQWPDKIPPAG